MMTSYFSAKVYLGYICTRAYIGAYARVHGREDSRPHVYEQYLHLLRRHTRDGHTPVVDRPRRGGAVYGLKVR